jgi:hypothetical protein
VGLTVTVATPAACVTTTACPARSTVALRLDRLEGFAAAVSVTLPLPVPLAGATVTQGNPDTALHTASP